MDDLQPSILGRETIFRKERQRRESRIPLDIRSRGNFETADLVQSLKSNLVQLMVAASPVGGFGWPDVEPEVWNAPTVQQFAEG